MAECPEPFHLTPWSGSRRIGVGPPGSEAPGFVPLTPDAEMEQFEQLYGQHAPAVRAYLAARLPAEAAEDAFQEVWTRLWQKQPHPQNVRAWLLRVAHNLTCDHYRRQSRERAQRHRLAQQAPAANTPGEDPPSPWAAWKAALRRCLEKLSPQQRKVAVLRCRGLSAPQIARQLDITPNNVHQHWHQAKGRLKTCMEQEGKNESLRH